MTVTVTITVTVQVVLPMLDSAVVGPGWISEADFLTGIALVQAMPGPLFNFSAYVGKQPTFLDMSVSNPSCQSTCTCIRS